MVLQSNICKTIHYKSVAPALSSSFKSNSFSYETLNGKRLVLKGKRCLGNGIVLYLQLRGVDYNWEWMGKASLIASWVASCKWNRFLQTRLTLWSHLMSLCGTAGCRLNTMDNRWVWHWENLWYKPLVHVQTYEMFHKWTRFPKMLVSITEKLFIKLALWKRHIHSTE